MVTTRITVYRYGKPVSGISVGLNWNNGIIQQGFKNASTNANGIAAIDHIWSGKATLFVNGKTQGIILVPMNMSVHL
jgi:hypothetical protein